MSSERKGIFISYSHADAAWLKRLRVHLDPLARKYDILIWDDTEIEAGDRWDNEIRSALDSAVAAVLLISGSFFASDYIYRNELPALLHSAEQKGTRIVPVVVSPFGATAGEVVTEFQAVNPISRPLVDMTVGDQERVLVKVAESIEAAIQAEKIQQLEHTVERQQEQMNEQQEIINQLVVFSMAFFLYEMLRDFDRCERGELPEYLYRKSGRAEHNLRWLRDNGYLEMTFQIAGLYDGQNIAQLVKLTPVGKYYVRIRREFEARAAQR